MPRNIEDLERLEADAINRLGKLDPSSELYDSISKSLENTSSLLDEHYKGLRKVDDSGKVTEEFPTRQPASVGNDSGDHEYFFEPSVTEVQAYLRRNPEALDRLRADDAPLRAWAEGESVPEIRTPNFEPNSGAITGYNVTPAKTHLDSLTTDQPAYGVVAEDMWRIARENAEKSGKAVKRYRDIKLGDDAWDYIKGGIKKGMSRVLAPAAIGAANAVSSRQAGPLYDAVGDLADYRQARMSPEEKATARAMGYNPEDAEDMASSEEITNRSPGATFAGELAGYGNPFNPSNLVQGGVTRALGYGGKGLAGSVIGRAGAAALGGAAANAEESVLGDMARYANEGAPIPIGEFAGNAALNAVGSAGIGAASGGVFDLGGQGIGAVRDAYRSWGRNAPLRTFERAGGEAGVFIPGMHPTEEMAKATQQADADALDETKAAYSPAGGVASDLAPEIRRSLETRLADEREITGKQMQEYYAHPAYNQKKVSARPAVEGLLDLAQRNFRERGPSDGAVMPMNPKSLDEIGGILRNYSQVEAHSTAEAPSVAAQTGGVVVPGELANRLYGLVRGDKNFVRPGQDAVIRPLEINAESLTILEDRIDTELDFARRQGAKDDPIWKRFNERVKAMRDEFLLYQDEAGNIVAPPPESVRPEPFAKDPGAVPPEGEMKVEAPPIEVKGGPPRKPEGLMGVGPGQPALPNGPFDPRAGKPQPKGGVDVLPQPVGVGGEGMAARPEGLYAVGPGRPPIPENPFDPRLPVSRERLSPAGQMNVQGGEYGPPPPLDPNARMGVGDRFNPEPVNPFNNNLDFVSQGGSISPQQTQQVQGTYNRPPEVRPEPVPQTQRNPYAFAKRGEPPHETPLPPSNRIEPQPDPSASPEEMAMRQHEIDDFLRKDREMNAADDRGGLEKMLDQQLEKAPKADQKEIDEIGAAQTADREQVAKDQKDYVEKLFAPGREARAAQADKVRVLSENKEVIDQAINQINEIERRLGGEGGLPPEQKKQMLLSVLEQKLGRKIDVEDLLRFGIISAGVIQLGTSDDENSAAVGAGILGFGLGRGKGKAPEAEAPKGPKKPTQPKEKLDSGKEVEGFSAMRHRQHVQQEGIERAMKLLGVEGNATLENRIRTFEQLPDRKEVDQTLLNEAIRIGKMQELRTAAGLNAYGTMKDRSAGGGSEGTLMKVLDVLGLRFYKLGEYLSGRHTRNTPPGDDGLFRNPYVRDPTTTLGEMQRTLVEDPARRLLDWTRGGPLSRKAGDRIYEALFGDNTVTVPVDEDEKKKRKSASP